MAKVEFYGVFIDIDESDLIQIEYMIIPENNESLRELEHYCELLEFEENYTHEILPTHIMLFQPESEYITAKNIEWYRKWHEEFVNDFGPCNGCINEGEFCLGCHNADRYTRKINRYREGDKEYRQYLKAGIWIERMEFYNKINIGV